MPRKIYLKNGKSFTYLTPEEKVFKYKCELDWGVKMAYGKTSDGWNPNIPGFKYKSGSKDPVYLTPGERRYREDYIKAYNLSKNSNGFKDLGRDLTNFNKGNRKL